MNEKYKYLKKNTIIFAISSFGNKILSFLLVPYYTALLTTAEYGTADILITTATLLVFILTLNISSSVLRFTLEKKENGTNILSYGFRILNIGTFLCCLGLGLLFRFDVLKWPIYYYVFVLLYFFATALYEIMTNYLRAIEKVKCVAVAGVLSSFFIILGNILLLSVVKAGLIGYLISLLLGPLLASIYCMVIAKQPLRTYTIVDCPRTLKIEMLVYCTPLIFNNVALWINAFLDRYFVTYYCGIAENGIYSVAGKIPTILSTCYSVFASAWTLSAIKEFDPDDKDGFFSNTYNTYGALMTTACSFIILLNVPLANFLYSKEFVVAWRYSSVLLLSVMFNTLTVFQGSIFSAAKKTKTIAITTIISAIVNTVFNVMLIPSFGALGAAVATAMAYFSMWLARYFFSKRYITMKINLLRDILVYVIVIIQIIFEHINNHFYFGQIICLILIVGLNWKYLNEIVKRGIRKICYGTNK